MLLTRRKTLVQRHLPFVFTADHAVYTVACCLFHSNGFQTLQYFIINFHLIIFKRRYASLFYNFLRMQYVILCFSGWWNSTIIILINLLNSIYDKDLKMFLNASRSPIGETQRLEYKNYGTNCFIFCITEFVVRRREKKKEEGRESPTIELQILILEVV